MVSWVSPKAVELCTKIVTVHALGIWYLSLHFRGRVSVHAVNMFLFSLGVSNLLVGKVYHVENEGYLLEVFMMRFFKRTLSIYAPTCMIQI